MKPPPVSDVRDVTDVTNVTFAKNVAPLVFERCVICHHDGGSAPFSLASYAAVRQHAQQIAAVTKSRFMPPWKAEPGYSGDFVGQHPLTAAEIAMIQRWVDQGAVEGIGAISRRRRRGQKDGS